MIRRGGGRAPPFILIGLLVLLIILGFNYWLLSSENADLVQQLEKLQAEVKISAVKQDQSEKKNAALHETVHEMDAIADKLKKKVEEEEETIRLRSQEGQKKDYELTVSKNKIVNLQEQINKLKLQAEEQEVELVKAKETKNHLIGERDAALEAVGDKDTDINTLKRQLEQEKTMVGRQQYLIGDLKKKLTHTLEELAECQDKLTEVNDKDTERQEPQEQKVKEQLAAYQREQLAAPQRVPGPMNIPGIENKDAQNKVAASPGVALKPVIPPAKKPPQEAHKPQIQPAGPAVVERPAPPVAANNQPLAPPVNVQPQEVHNEVLAPPPPQGQEQRLDELSRSKRGNNLEGRQDNGNIFELRGSAVVAAKPVSLHDTPHMPGQDTVAIGGHHGHADTEDKNDAQEQLDEPPQPHGHIEVEGDDRNNALEQIEDDDNLDAAVDDENVAAAANDLTYDQDEEGNDVRQQQQQQDRGHDDGGGAREEGVEEEEEEDEEDEEEEEEGALMLPRLYHQEDIIIPHNQPNGEALPVGFVKVADLNENPLNHRKMRLG